jgi:hypothetical protein
MQENGLRDLLGISTVPMGSLDFPHMLELVCPLNSLLLVLQVCS